ncbi:MAG: hypothetical protein ACK4ME_04140 [Fimbriimonadales bacterium]
MGTIGRSLGSLLTLTVLTSVATAQTLTWLGTLGGVYSTANGVSDDGSVVVGTSDTERGVRAFRWTPTTGMVNLGTLGGLESFADSVSADGSVIVGAADTSTNERRAHRWTHSTGMQIVEPRGTGSSARSVSADGSVIAGGYRVSFSPLLDHSYVRTPIQTYTLEPFAGIGAYGGKISRDGTVVVGSSTIYPAPSATTRAFRWTAAGGMQNLGQLGTGVSNHSSADCLSSDGSIVYGISDQGTGGNRVMFRWTEADGMQSTGVNMNPTDTTTDGSVVVGHVDFVRAVRWTQQNGLEDLNTTYAHLLSDGSSLKIAVAISPDGRYIVGGLQRRK